MPVKKTADRDGTKFMDPSLWGTLPKEMVLLVFARLPLRKINCLRLLSKEWHKDMTATADSEFKQTLDRAHPNMVAILWFVRSSKFFVRILDVTRRTWQHAYHFELTTPKLRGKDIGCLWTMMGACDAGLVCFVSSWKYTEADPMCIVVRNPLTCFQRVLPPLERYVSNSPPTMVQIKADSETKGYKVFVAGNFGGRLTVDVYDSSSRQWTATGASSLGFICGHAHKWWTPRKSPAHYLEGKTLVAYDSEAGRLEPFSANNPANGLSYALHNDRMYVLHRKKESEVRERSGWYCFKEYHAQNSAKDWMHVKTYPGPYDVESANNVGTSFHYACGEGFLMVIACFPAHSWSSVWLLNLSTGEWHELPAHLTGFGAKDRAPDVVCQALWNMMP